MPSTATLAMVRARIVADIPDADLQALIDRVESKLTRIWGAPGNTERVSTFLHQSGPILLVRPAESVATIQTSPYPITEDTAALDSVYYTVDLDTGTIDYTSVYAGALYPFDPIYVNAYRGAYPWQAFTAVTWTPINITDEWIEMVIDIVRLRLARRGFKSEGIGGEWRYTAADWDAEEDQIIDRLKPAGIVG